VKLLWHRDTDGGISDVYVKNLVTGDLTLLSTTRSGLKGNGFVWLTGPVLC
jgi:hypothetical protein